MIVIHCPADEIAIPILCGCLKKKNIQNIILSCSVERLIAKCPLVNTGNKTYITVPVSHTKPCTLPYISQSKILL